uniref:Fucosyltransferase n=1 Tax=Lepeophtheirus salmonis TaxID=72036 RepID=A0A0K2TTZ5_LEPSM
MRLYTYMKRRSSILPVLCPLLLLFYIFCSFPKGNEEETIKYILYWNSAYGSLDYGFCCGKEPYIKFNCRPKRNCFVTNNRSLLPAVSDFDAILFNHRTLSKDDIPSKRSPHQRYIFYALESPSNKLYVETSEWNGFFNWSMTYRLDSDFPILHGKLVSKTSDSQLTLDDPSIEHFGLLNAKRFTRGKKKFAAWFVSNCLTKSRRELLVNALRQHGIKVDIYGECGKQFCPKSQEASCWEKIESEYKFYLSFENSICKDYVTEKLWNALNRSIVPIVLGGGDYASFLPKNSYIDATTSAKFVQNPRVLAKQLKELDRSDAKYAEYFWWKNRFSARVLTVEDHAERHCQLCERLHEDASTKVISDLEEWWERQAQCRRVRLE